MDANSSQDFQDYWNEYKVVTQDEKYFEEDVSDVKLKSFDEEGVDEAEWLILAGLPHLTDVFLKGEMIDDIELEPVINVLSVHQANAVRRRVNSLNQTVTHRTKAKHKKPHIKDVFNHTRENVKSNNIDQHDSKIEDSDVAEVNLIIHSYDADCKNNINEIRTIDNEPKVNKFEQYVPLIPQHEIFRRSRTAHPEGDIVASENADGIRMLGFQKLGTMRQPYKKCPIKDNWQVSSHPIPSNDKSYYLRDNLENKLDSCNDYDSLGFEYMSQLPSMCQFQNEDNEIDKDEILFGRTWVDTLAEEDVTKLKPLLFVELSAVFDRAGVPLPKIKPHKRRKKQEGNVFGVSLTILIEHDFPMANSQSHYRVPLIFSKILGEIEKRGLNEQGVLRIAGHKAKVDRLCQEIEKNFYIHMQEVDQILQRSAIHDLTSVLKKLLRDLPEPILTSKLINVFYQSHCLQNCEKALNLLVLLLPVENRLTLLSIMSFVCKLVEHEENNKMNSHNVAMIIAPSIFPPRYIHTGSNNKGTNDLKSEIELAAVSCKITELLMKCKDRLNIVPSSLILQLRRMNDLHKFKIKNNGVQRLLGYKRTTDYVMNEDTRVQNETILVTALQFGVTDCAVVLNVDTTVGAVVLRIIDIGSTNSARDTSFIKHIRKKDMKQRVLTELAPNGNLSCLLATADPETALRTHFLYECGGNIRQRRIEPSAVMLAVYQQNPTANWIIQCDHRNAIKHK